MSRTAKAVDVDVVFVAEGDTGLAEAYFLVASIARHRQPGHRYLLYRPQGASPLPAALRHVMETAGVEARVVPAPPAQDASGSALWRGPLAALRNRLLAAGDPGRTGRISVLMNTDTLFLEPVDFVAQLGANALAAVLSDFRTSWENAEEWQPVFDFFRAKMPEERIGPLKQSDLDYPPYYESGLVIFRNRVGKTGDFRPAAIWAAMVRDMLAEAEFAFDPESADKIALSVIAAAAGPRMRRLPRRMHFNVAASAATPDTPLSVARYKNFGQLWRASHVGRQAMEMWREAYDAEAQAEFVETYRDILVWERALRRCA